MNKLIDKIAIICISFATLAFAGDFDVRGYWKNFFVVYEPPDIGETEYATSGEVDNRLNLKLIYDPADFLSMRISYDLIPRFVDNQTTGLESLGEFFGGFSYRVDDLKSAIYPDSADIASFGLYQNLDRLLISIALPFADVDIGRQAIAWGSGHAVNPTDVLTPITFTNLDIEERPGVDAMRIRIPFGMMNELDAGYLPGEDFDFKKGAAYLKGRFYVLQTDFSIIAINFNENLLAGIDMTRAIGNAGSWIEASYTRPGLFAETDSSEDGYFRVSTGADYILTDGTYLFAEYHYNGAGETKAENYTDNLYKTAYQSGGVYLMGRHYVIVGGSHSITLLLSGSAQLMANVTDPSALFAPQFEYNFAENVYISAGAFMGIGKKPEPLIYFLTDTYLPIALNSEFGTYPDMFFTTFRVYF